MIQMKIDQAGVIKSFEELKAKLTRPDKIGRVMQVTAARMWVPRILERLGVSTSTSGYEAELSDTMMKLDKDFVELLGSLYDYGGQSMGRSTAWADRTEEERRASGGYNQGEITSKIEQAIKASEPIKTGDSVMVGIGEYNILDNLFSSLGVEKKWKLWQILNYGTGTLGASGSPVVRTKKQIFFNRKIKKGVLASTTVNPGFKGREFFVKMDGSMHQGDYMVKRTIIRYINKVIKNLSYRK